jgi:hypothetical protein
MRKHPSGRIGDEADRCEKEFLKLVVGLSRATVSRAMSIAWRYGKDRHVVAPTFGEYDKATMASLFACWGTIVPLSHFKTSLAKAKAQMANEKRIRDQRKADARLKAEWHARAIEIAKALTDPDVKVSWNDRQFLHEQVQKMRY